MNKRNSIIVYQTKNGAIELKGDLKKETLWANLQQIADLFEMDKSGISRHINNIYKTAELNRKSTVAIFATVQKEGKREVKRNIEYFNLDMILSIGYRVNSKTATKFRQWATKTLRSHIVDGYTINSSIISKNYEAFLNAVEDVKILVSGKDVIQADQVLDLIKTFANTWFSLDAYDKSALPQKGLTKKQVEFTATELAEAISKLKKDLIDKKEATEFFAQEKNVGNLEGIIGNIFQSVFGQDAYSTQEEKAAHLHLSGF